MCKKWKGVDGRKQCKLWGWKAKDKAEESGKGACLQQKRWLLGPKALPTINADSSDQHWPSLFPIFIHIHLHIYSPLRSSIPSPYAHPLFGHLHFWARLFFSDSKLVRSSSSNLPIPLLPFWRPCIFSLFWTF